MPSSAHLSPGAAIAVTFAVLIGGAYVAQVVDRLIGHAVARTPPRGVLIGPVRDAARALRVDTAITERPDLALWVVAPAAYAAVAAAALSVVPLGRGVAIADVRTGIVVFGAAEALAIVAVYLHGWAPNAHLSLIGGHRFVALGLSYELLSMFALIAASLPAESLRVSAIVTSQEALWNVIRQPLGLPLWVVVTLGVTFMGPLDVVDGPDLEGGSSAEISGRHRLLWETARGGMRVVLSAMGAAMFLGGWLGPGLPGWAWMLLKTLAVLALVTWVAHRFARVPVSRAVPALWVAGLPLSFVNLAWAGIEALE